MTIENWLTIAVIISQLIAPWLNGLFIRSRTAQPTPTPELNQPKKRIQIIGDWINRFFASPWKLPQFLIALNMYMLLTELRSTTPVTRGVVYRISLDMAGILYGIVAMFLNILWQSIRRQWEVNREQRDFDLRIIDLISAVTDGMKLTHEFVALTERLQTELDKSKQGRVRKFIKGLFGD